MNLPFDCDSLSPALTLFPLKAGSLAPMSAGQVTQYAVQDGEAVLVAGDPDDYAAELEEVVVAACEKMPATRPTKVR